MALWGKKKDERDDMTSMPPGQQATFVASSAVMPSRAPENSVVQSTQRQFGIDHTIQLMRTLPRNKDPDLVIAVMKATLESVNVRLPDIVADASNRLAEIEGRVGQLKSEIASFEREMDIRLKEIVRLEAAHAETTKVKECLESSVADFPIVEDEAR